MKAFPRRLLNRLALMTTVLLFVAADALAQTKTAHEVAEAVKNEMITLIGDREKIAAEGEGKYYEAVVKLFDPVVDFGFIANGVMGDYAKTASDEQKQKFAGALKESLLGTVSTYTQGLGGNEKFSIRVLPPRDSDAGKNNVQVGLEVIAGESTNQLSFSMFQNKEQEWKIYNMTLNGINLGITFRAQFAQAVKKAEGNLDVAIAGWSS